MNQQVELLQAEINELQTEETVLIDKLRNAERNTPEFTSLYEKVNDTRVKMAIKKQELTEQSAIEGAQTEAVELFDTLTVPGTDDSIPLAYLLTTDLIPLEDKMSIITSALQNKLANAAIVKTSLEADNGRLQVRNEALETDNSYLTKRNDELDLKAADLESKLHNAGVQIEELKAENSRKDADISKLRDQLTNSNQSSTTKVEVESMVEALAKRPAIYDVRWESELNRTHKLATLAETGEEIRFHYFNEGIYRTINEEELLQFRKEKEDRELQEAAEAAKLAEEDMANIALVVPTFHDAPSQEESPAIGLVETTPTMVARPVTREEFDEFAASIEKRLFRLEQAANIG